MTDGQQPTPEDGSAKDLDDYRKQLLVYREELHEGYVANQHEFDRYVIMLSGGAMAVTFAFAKDYVRPPDVPVCPSLLLMAWLLWAGCLGCAVFAFFMSARANQVSVDRLDIEMAEFKAPYKLDRLGEPYTKIGRCLTIVSGWLLLLGAVPAGIFVCLNI